jgi:hypothetical protein
MIPSLHIIALLQKMVRTAGTRSDCTSTSGKENDTQASLAPQGKRVRECGPDLIFAQKPL